MSEKNKHQSNHEQGEQESNEHHGHENHNHSDHEEHDHHNHESHNHGDHEGHDHSDHDHHDHDHHDHGGHGGHEHHHHGNFKELFLKSLPIALIIIVISPMMGIEFFFQFTFPYSDILAAVLSTGLLIYGGRPFFQGAVDEFKQKEPGMMALVSLGLGVSYLYSVYAVIARYVVGQDVMDFFFEFASLIIIMLLGHWIEMRAVSEAGDAQKSLAELLPKDAHVVDGDDIVTKPVTELVKGDVVRVQAGENIPSDGVITKGETRINEALLTGESKPVEKNKGDQVIGGSTNGDSVIYVEVEETGDESFISQVQNLVSQAQNQPTRAENMAHKVAGWLFYIAVSVAVIAFVTWLALEDLQTAVMFTVTTLVIACPHALGLAIPLVVARSTSLGASRGLLVKDRHALELARNADVMLLDKTGTLTTGEFEVHGVDSVDDRYSEDELTAIMAGIEAGSSHPIAQSITKFAEDQDVSASNFDSIDVISGEGVEGELDGTHFKLISMKAYGEDLDIDVPVGATLSVLVEDGQAIGTVALGDKIKDSSAELIQILKDNDIEPIMATGDNEAAAKTVAEELGMKYFSNQSPEDKYDLVEKYTDEGKNVVMVGDGVNDAPSLALADVGVAIGAGTQVALDSADVILTQSDPGDIESFIELANKTVRKMKQNLVWGAGYNFIAIPLAAGILAPIGITLTPAMGAILMSLSTVIVAINAIFLRLDD